ncbi:hypothetical protein HMPREF9554_02433, partial [Treponema phagedenis F0421]|uniref:hypothetical protein n=1 Tax=Treponema phagedenis TaxID=162 RepID=UPI0001F63FFB
GVKLSQIKDKKNTIILDNIVSVTQVTPTELEAGKENDVKLLFKVNGYGDFALTLKVTRAN